MRFSRIAVCTLTAMVAGEMTAHASDPPKLDTPLPPSFGDFETLTTAPPVATVSAIATPETLSQPSVLPTADRAVAIQPAALPDRLPASAAIDWANMSPPSTSEPMLEERRSPLATIDFLPTQAASLANRLLPESQSGVTPSGSCNVRQASGLSSEGTLAQDQEGQLQCPRPAPIAPLTPPEPYEPESSPALSIYIPTGIGADNTTGFISSTYQSETRNDDGAAGTVGVGFGYGDADKNLGVEISYTLANNDNFGEGGFNAKLHRRFAPDWAAAVGWNGFLNIGRNDFEQSLYGVVTKVFRTQDSIDQPFSRISITMGVGDGQFRSNGAVDDGVNNINVFGNVAIRIARPLSFITEWTGQDLAVGLSIAPFRNFPLTITPAVRDIAGAGDEARFVLGAGIAFRL